MRPFIVNVAALTTLAVSAFPSAAQTAENDSTIKEHGYVFVGTADTDSDSTAVSESRRGDYYAKVSQGRKRISLLLTHTPAPSTGAPYLVTNYKVDCANQALRHISSQSLGSNFLAASPEIAMLKTFFQKPQAGSIPEKALRIACQA